MTATQLSAIESDGSYYVVLMIIEERGEEEGKKSSNSPINPSFSPSVYIELQV